jgi:hypothetical protein
MRSRETGNVTEYGLLGIFALCWYASKLLETAVMGLKRKFYRVMMYVDCSDRRDIWLLVVVE